MTRTALLALFLAGCASEETAVVLVQVQAAQGLDLDTVRIDLEPGPTVRTVPWTGSVESRFEFAVRPLTYEQYRASIGTEPESVQAFAMKAGLDVGASEKAGVVLIRGQTVGPIPLLLKPL